MLDVRLLFFKVEGNNHGFERPFRVSGSRRDQRLLPLSEAGMSPARPLLPLYCESQESGAGPGAEAFAGLPAGYGPGSPGDPLTPDDKEKKAMTTGISREEALELLKEYIQNPHMIKHCLASEAVLGALAERLGEDREQWAMAGLLHDLDVELTNADLAVHGMESVRILNEQGVEPGIVEAIKRHNEQACGEKRCDRLHHALAAGETITGLITATALVQPDKRLASVKPKSVVKRMKEKAFAASVNRDIIRECELIGIPLAEFAEIAVGAMQGISNELGM
jgi:putative nucleotidyltransferase with HDIG domain